jgi:hypothetical protein
MAKNRVNKNKELDGLSGEIWEGFWVEESR